MGFADRARFYPINGREYPSVTTALSIIDKSGPLMHWASNLERKAFETALLDVLTQPGAKDPEYVLGALAKAVTGKKAFLREQDKAANIGSAAHAMIEWHTRAMLGEKAGPEPSIPDGAMVAVEAWKDWVAEVGFVPLSVEQTVYCEACGYAGKYDWIAKVRGIVTLGDYKTGKAIYPEAFLQNIAYRHAAQQLGTVTEQGIILRLPKTLDDPAFETMIVPAGPMDDFLHALGLWRWQRRMEGKPAGGAARPHTNPA